MLRSLRCYLATGILLLLGMSEVQAQYCLPTFSSGCTVGDQIQNVNTTGGITNFTNNGSGCNGSSPNYYTYHSNLTVSQIQGASFTLNMQAGSAFGQGFRVWIDWNSNNSFADAGEAVYVSPSSSTALFSTVITVPLTASPGLKRMRVLCRYATIPGITDYCGTNMAYGECEDYNVMVINPTPCSTPPTSVSVTPNPLNVCAGSLHQLTASPNPYQSNLTFQWYENGVAIPGATATSYSFNANASTNFHVVVKCGSNPNDSTISNTATVNVTGPCAPVCIPSGGLLTGYYLNNITSTNGMTNFVYTANSYSTYQDRYTSLSTSQMSGGSINIAMSASAGTNLFFCWIDWTNDNDFNDPGETIWTTTSYATSYNGIINVPASQPSGSYRVRFGQSYSGTINPCGPANYGSYVDVRLDVINTPCNDPSINTQANPITTIVTNDSVCANSLDTVMVGPMPLALGWTYQLQRSPNLAGPYTNVGAAQASKTFPITVPSTAWYRVVVLCQNSPADTTVPSMIYAVAIPPSPTTVGGTRCGPGTVSLSASVANPYTIAWYNSLTNQLPVGIGPNFTTPLIGTTSTFYAQANIQGSTYHCMSARIPTTAEVRTIPNPNITVAVNPGNVVCVGTNVTFTATATAGGTAPVYTWKRNGITVGTNSPTFSSSTLANNDQIFVTLVSNADCAPSSPDTSNVIQMTVENPGTPSALLSRSPSGTICKGVPVNFKVSAINRGPNPMYQWKINGVNQGPATSDTTFVATGLNNGDQVQVQFLSSSTCATPSTVMSNTLTIPVSTPVATLTPASTAIVCAPDSILLSANTGTGFSYQWYKEGVLIPGATGANYYANDSAYYSVRVTNNFGCDTMSNPYLVNIKPAPVAAIPTPPSTFFCDSGAVVLTSAAGNIPGHNYQWFRNNNSIVGATNWNYQVTQSGTYSLQITRPNGCSATSNGVTMTTYTMPQATITQNGSQLSTMSGYTYYQWYLGTTPIAGATSNTFTAMQSGYYKVVVRDPNGCERQSNYVFVIGLGIEQSALAKGIQIYPNPATSTLFVKAPEQVNIRISDVTGREVLKQNGQQTFAIDQLQPGLYMIQIFDRNNRLIKVDKIEKR